MEYIKNLLLSVIQGPQMITRLISWSVSHLLLSIILQLLLASPGSAATFLEEMAGKIAYEASLPSTNTQIGRPLPLASSWMTGDNSRDPQWWVSGQLQRIAEGNYILPIVQYDPAKFTTSDMQTLAALRLPFSIRVNNIITRLGQDPFKSGMLIDDTGTTSTKVISVFGPLEIWEAAGRSYVTSWWRNFASIYPNPPVIIIVDNNEQSVLSVTDMAKDIRYDGPPDPQLWSDNYAARRQALQAAWRNELPTGWRNKMKFVGYGELPFAGNNNESESYRYFDGGSWSYYLNDWQVYGNNDFHIWSPQLDSMNVHWGMETFAAHYTSFWLENSVWGDESKIGNYYWNTWKQQFTPERYGGWIGFGMWMIRPRVVRDFYSSTSSWAPREAYIKELYRQVNSVHNNETLKSFWRKGMILKSTLQDHPSQYSTNPNYLLEADANYNITNNTSISNVVNVYGVALKLADNVLIYAHAPQGTKKDVTFQIPGYGDYYVPCVEQRGTTVVLNLRAPRIIFSVGSQPVNHTSGPVSFGFLSTGCTIPIRTFTVKNIGIEDLVISNVSVPEGYTLVEPLANRLVQGESDTFTVQLNSTAAVGDFKGNLVISSNDDNEGIYVIPLTASIFKASPRVGEIQIPPDKVGAGGVYDFTVLLTETSLPREIFAIANGDGGDVRAYADADRSTTLTVDVITWDNVAGKATLRVGPTFLSDHTTTSLWITYGNPVLSSQDGTKAYDPKWIGYWPLDEVPNISTATMLNRISNKYHGIIQQGSTPIKQVSGKVGNALEFSAALNSVGLDRVFLGTSINLPNQWTIIGWAIKDADYRNFLGRCRSGDARFFTGDGGCIQFTYNDGTKTGSLGRMFGINGQWQQYAIRQEASTVQGGIDNLWGPVIETSGTLTIDSLGAGRVLMYSSWDGKIDDIQIHGITRSDAWVTTEYEQTSNPTEFAIAKQPQDINPIPHPTPTPTPTPTPIPTATPTPTPTPIPTPTPVPVDAPVASPALLSKSASPPLQIDYVDTVSAPAGAWVTLWGIGFGESSTAGTLSIGSTLVTGIQSWTDRRIDFQVPASAQSGFLSARVSGQISNSLFFTVRPGNIYYVNPNHPVASDTGSGLMTQPWKTIGRGLLDLKPGDTLYLGAAIYKELMQPPAGGSLTLPIMIKALPGVSVVLQTDTLSGPMDSIVVDGNLHPGLSDLIFSGLVLRGTGNAIKITGGTARCKFYGIDADACQTGLMLDGGSYGTLVAQSAFNHCTNFGVALQNGASEIILRDCTVSESLGSEGGFVSDDTVASITLARCLSSKNRGDGFKLNAAGVIVNECSAYQNTNGIRLMRGAYMQNCWVYGNKNTGIILGRMGAENSTHKLVNCTVAGPHATSNIQVDAGAAVSIRNTIAVGGLGPAIAFKDANATPFLDHIIVQTAGSDPTAVITMGTTKFSTQDISSSKLQSKGLFSTVTAGISPYNLFQDYEHGDLRLSRLSPARRVGTILEAPAIDFFRQLRELTAGVIDIGACEYSLSRSSSALKNWSIYE